MSAQALRPASVYPAMRFTPRRRPPSWRSLGPGIIGFSFDMGHGAQGSMPRTPGGCTPCPSLSSAKGSGRLLERQRVAVRICEPRDPRAARRGPRAAVVLLHALVAQRLAPARAQRRDRRVEILDPPAEHGVG